MKKEDSYVLGVLYYDSDLNELSKILDSANIRHIVGEWAIRLKDYPSTFKIAYVGNITPEEPYEIEVDGYDVSKEIVSSWCKKLSQVFNDKNIAFNFTHFDSDESEIEEYVNEKT